MKVVSNASPLIFLSKLEVFDLLLVCAEESNEIFELVNDLKTTP